MCQIHTLHLDYTVCLFTVMMGCYLSGQAMMSSSLCLANVLPSLQTVCFIHTRTRSPARCNITHLRKIRRTLHPVESPRIGSRCRGQRRAWGGEDVLERAYREAVTGSTWWMGPLWGRRRRRWTAGPLAAHRVRQKQRATRTHFGYKARSRRNHKTGSVGGKQTERTPNSSQSNLQNPLLIQVWNLINSSGKVHKAKVLYVPWEGSFMITMCKLPAETRQRGGTVEMGYRFLRKVTLVRNTLNNNLPHWQI